MDKETVHELVQRKYGEAATRAAGGAAACCGDTCGCSPITTGLYDQADTAELPVEAVQASLGCGNPTLLADLRPGETVLDLGSGGGLDVLLSARRVGPTGMVYGLDMTEEMLALARANQQKAGVSNVRFLKGTIEEIPLPDGSVDVIISNCVINLAADKQRVLAEAFRVLRPEGRLAVSDIVARGELPAALRQSLELWAGCVAGALDEAVYRSLLAGVGFVEIDVEPWRVYQADAARDLLASAGVDLDLEAVDGRLMSAFIRAVKPA